MSRPKSKHSKRDLTKIETKSFSFKVLTVIRNIQSKYYGSKGILLDAIIRQMKQIYSLTGDVEAQIIVALNQLSKQGFVFVIGERCYKAIGPFARPILTRPESRLEVIRRIEAMIEENPPTFRSSSRSVSKSISRNQSRSRNSSLLRSYTPSPISRNQSRSRNSSLLRSYTPSPENSKNSQNC